MLGLGRVSLMDIAYVSRARPGLVTVAAGSRPVWKNQASYYSQEQVESHDFGYLALCWQRLELTRQGRQVAEVEPAPTAVLVALVLVLVAVAAVPVPLPLLFFLALVSILI